MIRTAQYVDNYLGKTPLICDLDDILSKRYTRVLNGSLKVHLLGNFSYLLPIWLQNILNKYFQKAILKYEIKKISIREKSIATTFDVVTLVSPSEAQELANSTGKDIVALPPCICNQNKVLWKQENVFLYLGNYGYAQNVASVAYIVNKILPILDSKNIDYIFYFVGSGVEHIEQFLQNSKKCIATGRVESVSEYMYKAKVMLCPFLFGTGIKTKILEAMSYGLPVITNQLGVEGIGNIPDDTIAVAKDEEQMVDYISILFKEPEHWEKLSQNSYVYAKKYFSCETIANRYFEIIERCTKVN